MVVQIDYAQQMQELLEEKSILYEENTRLRTELGELEEEDTRLREDVASCQRQISAYKLRDDRRTEFLRNRDLIPMEKLVALEALERVEKKRDDISVPIDIKNRDIADALGTTPETIGKKFNALNRMGLLSYTTRTEWDHGEFITVASVAFTDLVKTPALIQKAAEDKQGGPREKKCKNPQCDSTNFDSYTALYCRECNHVSIYGQVGLSHDASVLNLIAAFSDENNVHVDGSAKCALPEGVKPEPFPIYHDAFGEIDGFSPEIAPEPESILSWEETTIPLSRQDTEALPEEDIPVTPPPVPPVSDVVTNWLRDRIGNGRIIVATGQLETAYKYIAKPASYTPDLDAYLAGQAGHIYGSWLRDPETGLTRVLCFEIDRPEHDALGYDYLTMLAAAGASPVYWQRYAQGRERGHLELYFDHPVNAEIARAWCIDVCPQLADIPEIYPTADKANNALSWPLYQRIGKDIYPCIALAMLPTGDLFEVPGDSLAALAQLVTRIVTPSALFDGYPVPPQPTTCKPKGGALLESPSPIIPVLSEKDLARQIIAEQNAALTWDMIADRCGGLKRGKFCAIWRGERTPSVTINKDGQRATDWGQTGTTWPRNFDKYEAWCMIEGIEKKTDLAQRCKALRQHQNSALAVHSSSADREEFYV